MPEIDPPNQPTTPAQDAGAAAQATPGADTPHDPAPMPAPWLHADSSSLRFWVALPGAPAMGATISQATLHHRFQAALDGSDAVGTYRAHQAEIDAAVRRRVDRGSIEPVMLREADLPAPARR